MQYLYDETGRRYLDVSCSALCMLCLLSIFFYLHHEQLLLRMLEFSKMHPALS